MNKTSWLAIWAGVALAGCGGGKVEIAADCSLKDSGEARCTFRNKGNARGTACEHLVLTKKPELIAKEQAEKGRYNENWQRILNMAAEKEKNALANTASTAKEEAKSRGVGLDKVIEERRADFVALAAAGNSYISAEQICSGLLDAGGSRDVGGRATFAGKPLRTLCALTSDGGWSDGCNVSTIAVGELDKNIRKAIEAAPDK